MDDDDCVLPSDVSLTTLGLHSSEATLNFLIEDERLNKVIELFAEDGYMYLEAIISVLYDYRELLPRDIQVGVFAIMGRYLHTFTSLIRNGGYKFPTAHNMAIMDVLADPNVGAYIQDMLKGAVGNGVASFMGE